MQTPQPASLKGSYLNQFKRWMILLLIVLQALTVISILFFSSLASESALLAQAKKILNGATTEAARQTEDFLGRAVHEVSLASELIAHGVLTADNIEQVESYFISQLNHNDAFAGVYLGTESGEFLYVSRDPDKQAGGFRTKHVVVDNTSAETTLWWRNINGSKTASTVDDSEAFDPRTRPWFMAAVAANDFIWTKPYIFFTAQKLGITAARPVKNADGGRIGVIGIDLELDALAGFLAKLDISDSGSAFIANSDGVLLATPTMKGLKTSDLSSLSISAMNDPVGRQLLDMIRAASRSSHKSNSATFTVGKERFISDSMPLSLADSEQWLIGTYAAKSDFLTHIRESDKRNIYLACAILVIAIVIGGLLATSAWTPLELLHRQANKDQLTQLFNRHYLTKFGGRLINEAREQEEALSVVIVDLDHFKMINDGLGHAAGDAVIKGVAKRLQKASRAHDIVARFGGEEFVMLLPTADARTAKDVMERASAGLKTDPIIFEDQEIAVTFSAGVCEISPTIDKLESLLSAADKALYQAKRDGRDRVVIAMQQSGPAKEPPPAAIAATAHSH